jgi:Beta-propeller repeat
MKTLTATRAALIGFAMLAAPLGGETHPSGQAPRLAVLAPPEQLPDRPRMAVSPAAIDEARKKSATDANGPMQLVFEENRGQADPRVKFLARGAEYVLFITAAEAVLADRRSGQAVRVHLRGARPDVEVVGLEPLSGRIHYIRGRDPAGWRTDVATYARVAYRQPYPGIDAIYKRTTGSRFEQEFLIRPDANPAAIRLGFDGVQKVTVDNAGNLVLTTAGAPMRLGRPRAYQEVEGVRRAISVAWNIRGSKGAGFRLGPYDRSHVLVIDPVIEWATYLGGSGADQAFSIAVDRAGNSYVTGDTDSINFPTTDGSRLAIGASMTDVFVTKLNSTGQALVYSVYIGGSGTDGGRGIAVDPSGNAYVAGFTTSTDFPTTAGAFQPQHGGGAAGVPLDAFALKLGPDGTLVYATYLGGRDDDVALGIAVDPTGRAHVVGGTHSANFPAVNAVQPRLGGGGFDLCGIGSCPRNAFVTRLNALGLVEYSTFLGGAQDAVANAIAIDDLNSVYVTGSTGGSFPTTPGSFQPNFRGGSADAFVARIDENAALGWATYLGGADIDVGLGIAVDRERRPHVVGSTSSKDFPDFCSILHCFVYSFVLTLRADGSARDWSFQPDTLSPAGVAVDEQGQTHIVGTDDQCNFDILGRCGLSVGVSVETFGPNGEFRSFIFIGDTPPSAASRDIGRAIATSGSSLWVTGVTYGNFPATPGAFQSTAPGGAGDAFVARIDVAADATPGSAGGGNGGGGGSSKKCLIATAAFGSPLAWEVVTLRRFRDRALLTHAPGRLLVRAYYRLSPPLARAVASHPLLAAGVRSLLGPVAVGADFALDRPAVAVGLVGVGLAAMIGLAAMRGKHERRTRAAAGICLLGGVLLVAVFALGPRRTISPAPVATAAVGRSEKPQDAPGPSGTPAVPGRLRTAQAGLDFRNLVGSKVSVTPLNPFAPSGERRFAVTSDLIEGIFSADSFVVTDPHRARVLGLEAGDTIVRINGYPPTGLVAAITTLQRDPDRAAVVLEIDRHGTRIVQSHRVR